MSMSTAKPASVVSKLLISHLLNSVIEAPLLVQKRDSGNRIGDSRNDRMAAGGIEAERAGPDILVFHVRPFVCQVESDSLELQSNASGETAIRNGVLEYCTSFRDENVGLPANAAANRQPVGQFILGAHAEQTGRLPRIRFVALAVRKRGGCIGLEFVLDPDVQSLE